MALLFACLAAPAAEAQILSLQEGRQDFISFDRPVARVAVSNPAVAQASATRPNELRILALTPGRTDVAVWLEAEGAQPTDGEPVLGERLSYVVTVYPDIGAFQRFLSADPEMQGISVELDGPRVLLQGDTATRQAHLDLQRLAMGYFGEGGFIDLTKAGGNRMVAVDISFYAVSASTMRALGLNFQALGHDANFSISGPGNTNAEFGTDALEIATGLPIGQAFNLLLGSTSDNVVGVLSALDESNLARALAEPTLLVRSGEEASFLAGGEIPIPVAQGEDTISIEYREFGVELEISADVLSDDRIVLRVAPSVSELDFGNAVTISGTTIPALRRRSTETVIELADGQSFLLSGLYYTAVADIDQRIPILGDIPIIGALFRRTEVQQESQELIVLATPRLVQPFEPGQAPTFDRPMAVDPSATQWLTGENPVRDAIVEHGLLR